MIASGVCFWSFTFKLSAGKDKKAVKNEAKTAEILFKKNMFEPKNGLINSAII